MFSFETFCKRHRSAPDEMLLPNEKTTDFTYSKFPL